MDYLEIATRYSPFTTREQDEAMENGSYYDDESPSTTPTKVVRDEPAPAAPNAAKAHEVTKSEPPLSSGGYGKEALLAGVLAIASVAIGAWVTNKLSSKEFREFQKNRSRR